MIDAEKSIESRVDGRERAFCQKAFGASYGRVRSAFGSQRAKDDGSAVVNPAALRDAVAASALEEGLSGSVAFDESGDRLPPGAVSLKESVDAALASQDATGYEDLGLIPCQVQDGELVNLLGPDARPIRLPGSAEAAE